MSVQGDPELGLRYWTWAGLQQFLVEHDLVICLGLGERDPAVLSPRGRELAATFLAMIKTGAG